MTEPEQIAESIRQQLAQKERDDLDQLGRAQTDRILEQLRNELRVTDQLLTERNRLLDLFDCPQHGRSCVPFAIDEVTRLRKIAKENAVGSPLGNTP